MYIKLKYLSIIFVLMGIGLFASPIMAGANIIGTLNSVAKVRDSAGFTKVIVILEEKTKVNIVSEKGDWYQILRKDGSRGWVAKELVDLAPKVLVPKIEKEIASSSIDKKNASSLKAVLKYNSKLRKTPDAKGDVVALLLGGSEVQTTETRKDWCAVKDKMGKTGWVMCSLLNVESKEIAEEPIVKSKSASTTPIVKSKVSSTTIEKITMEMISKYWEEEVNALRKAKKLRELKMSKSLEKTAVTWADYMGQCGKITHTRPDGKSMLAWADDKGLQFTERNSDGGWTKNYFTENIGYRLNVKPTLASVKSAMDSVLHSYLAEGPQGVHYRSVYFPDWNSVGAGYYATKDDKGNYKVDFVFHYGSLEVL